MSYAAASDVLLYVDVALLQTQRKIHSNRSVCCLIWLRNQCHGGKSAIHSEFILKYKHFPDSPRSWPTSNVRNGHYHNRRYLTNPLSFLGRLKKYSSWTPLERETSAMKACDEQHRAAEFARNDGNAKSMFFSCTIDNLLAFQLYNSYNADRTSRSAAAFESHRNCNEYIMPWMFIDECLAADSHSTSSHAVFWATLPSSEHTLASSRYNNNIVIATTAVTQHLYYSGPAYVRWQNKLHTKALVIALFNILTVQIDRTAKSQNRNDDKTNHFSHP